MARTRQRHIKQTPLFFQVVGGFVREKALITVGYDHDRPFASLGAEDGRNDNFILPIFRFDPFATQHQFTHGLEKVGEIALVACIFQKGRHCVRAGNTAFGKTALLF